MALLGFLVNGYCANPFDVPLALIAPCLVGHQAELGGGDVVLLLLLALWYGPCGQAELPLSPHGSPFIACVSSRHVPGSNCDEDMVQVLDGLSDGPVVRLWHKEHDPGVDAVVLPGGFSFMGIYLRSGPSRVFPIMQEVVEHAGKGGLVFGVQRLSGAL